MQTTNQMEYIYMIIILCSFIFIGPRTAQLQSTMSVGLCHALVLCFKKLTSSRSAQRKHQLKSCQLLHIILYANSRFKRPTIGKRF